MAGIHTKTLEEKTCASVAPRHTPERHALRPTRAMRAARVQRCTDGERPPALK